MRRARLAGARLALFLVAAAVAVILLAGVLTTRHYIQVLTHPGCGGAPWTPGKLGPGDARAV